MYRIFVAGVCGGVRLAFAGLAFANGVWRATKPVPCVPQMGKRTVLVFDECEEAKAAIGVARRCGIGG
eukprot:12912501-Prorocentrum_lima.AAC.1